MGDPAAIAAGFFVTKAAVRDADRSPDLLPARLVSLSRCVAPSYELDWGWDVEGGRSEAVEFGLAAERLGELSDWEQDHGMSFPNVFHSLEDARAFIAEFLPDDDQVMVVGAALPAGLTDAFRSAHRQPRFDAGTGELYGVYLVLSGARPLPDGGTRLGWELALYEEHQLACSWLCTGTEREIAEGLDVVQNAHGLIETYEDAARVHAWCVAHPEELEPGPYYPWLLVRYPPR